MKKSLDFLVDNMFIPKDDSVPEGISGYFIRSTAGINVEDDLKIDRDKEKPTIETVINLLNKKSKDSKDLGVVIAIHGYNTGNPDIKLSDELNDKYLRKDHVWDSYQKINKYINKDDVISKKSDRLVFIGYRWPSENVTYKNFYTSLMTLPFLLSNLLYGSLIVGLISFLLFFFWLSSPLFIFPIILATFFSTLVLTLMILRIIVYFRDTYRATHYAVNDLVELIRQIDQGLINCNENTEVCDINAVKDWENRRLKLSFIGHSMGGYVTTQVIRILSDIFDTDSIGKSNNEKTNKNPSSKIGRVFSLGRLILVSPDIPLLTITSGRSNFLRSSLRRFEEAYLFSNEGDLALRLASTAANYFSFPASSRKEGYRLGNVNVRPKDKLSSKDKNLKKESKKKYGILNFEELSDNWNKSLDNPLKKMSVLSNDLELNILKKMSSLSNYLELNMLSETLNQELNSTNQEKASKQNKNNIVGESVGTPIENEQSISDLFTYFDCTEYKDFTDDPKTGDEEHNVMILDKLIPPFTFWNYVELSWAYFAYSTGKELFCGNGRDVHGGYFKGKFSQTLMYRLAFVGFQEFLDTFPDSKSPDLNPDFAKRHEALDKLNEYMKSKQIKTVLSPERYIVDVIGKDHKDIRKKMLCGSEGLISCTFEEEPLKDQ
ncbi:MAG: alpha/beta hydrolase [Brasilonema angustatum HA4187-MV1]|jgi:pimeloyl-ACP methyl ester carboxylesterase|nr:alpha/beta hydrolase [Brasilonema angustatum HA4187-MV1]